MGSQRVYDASIGDWSLQALFCPTGDSYYGISSDRYGVMLIPCFNCLANMLTSCQDVADNAPWGPQARTNCDALLNVAAVRDGGGSVVAYAESLACILQPGWGWVNSTFGSPGSQVTRTFVQKCPVNTYSPGGERGLIVIYLSAVHCSSDLICATGTPVQLSFLLLTQKLLSTNSKSVQCLRVQLLSWTACKDLHASVWQTLNLRNSVSSVILACESCFCLCHSHLHDCS